jgi:hypothetical protein
MRITLLLESKPIGFMEYEIINDFELIGQLGAIVTTPMTLARVIEGKIKHNEDIVVSGGLSPEDLSRYFDGVVLVLEKIKAEVRGFDYQIPESENPYLEEVPEDLQDQVH